MKLIAAFIVLLSLWSCSVEGHKQEERSVDGWSEIKTPWVVEIFSEQFKWTVRYSGEDNVLGQFDYKLMNDENPLGLMTTQSIESRLSEVENEFNRMDSTFIYREVREEFFVKYNQLQKHKRLLEQMKSHHISSMDESALNDIIINDTMVLCVDKEYQFMFRSKDVIHSAYFPHFRAQMNTVPGMPTRFNFTPTETTKEGRIKAKDNSFEFMLMCNKICGVGHNAMKMVVRVVEPEEYYEWLESNGKNRFKKIAEF